MSKKFKTKNSKYKSALFGAVAVAASFAMFASACTPASDDGEEESNTSTRVDEQILKNGNFEFFNDNDGTYILGSADNWSSATDSGATSSDSASGVIGTTAAAWNRLTDPELPQKLWDNAALDSGDEDYVNYNASPEDLPFKDPASAIVENEDDDEDDTDDYYIAEGAEYIANPDTHGYRWAEEDGKTVLYDSEGNSVEYYEKDGKVYADAYPELYLSGNKHTCGIDENRFPGGVYWHDQGSPEPEHVILVAPLPILADDSETCYATTHDADMAFDRVLEYAGASLVRDIVDARIASEARDGTATYMDGTTAESRRKIDSGEVDASYSEGGMIDSQSVVGGWPEYSADTGNEANDKTDSDGDGMPDWFEVRFGLDPDSASDASGMTLDRHGRYSNLEMYLHWLVRDVMASGTEGGSYAALD